MSDKDGGQAFPQPFVRFEDRDGSTEYAWAADMNNGGMTLRDYFAAQIIAGIVYSARGDGIEIKSPLEEAETAYAYADAMLKAREA